jgi:hypothetical protein
MLTRDSIDTAIDIVESVSDKNSYFTAVPGSILDSLMDLSTPLLPKNIDADEGFGHSELTEALIRASSVKQEGVTEHDEVLHEVAEFGKQRVAAVLDVTGNMLLPMIERVGNMVNDRLSSVITETLPIVVEHDLKHRIWYNSMFVSQVRRYEASGVPNDTRSIDCLIEGDYAEIRKCFKTGLQAIDEELAQLVDGLSHESIDQLLTAFRTDNNLLWCIEDLYRADPVLVVLLHIFAYNNSDKLAVDFKGDLQDIRLYCSNVVGMTGRFICDNLNRDQINERTERVISYIPSKETMDAIIREGYPGDNIVLRVNRQLYKRYLNSGGTAESFIGNVISDRMSQLSMLTENIARHQQVFDRFEMNVLNARRSKRHLKASEFIKEEIIREIQKLNEDDYMLNKDQMFGAVSQHLEHACTTEFEDIFVMVRHILCNSVFAGMGCATVVHEYEAAKKHHPEKTNDELRFIVVVNYVSKWIASFIEKRLVAA